MYHAGLSPCGSKRLGYVVRQFVEIGGDPDLSPPLNRAHVVVPRRDTVRFFAIGLPALARITSFPLLTSSRRAESSAFASEMFLTTISLSINRGVTP